MIVIQFIRTFYPYFSVLSITLSVLFHILSVLLPIRVLSGNQNKLMRKLPAISISSGSSSPSSLHRLIILGIPLPQCSMMFIPALCSPQSPLFPQWKPAYSRICERQWRQDCIRHGKWDTESSWSQSGHEIFRF